MKLKKGNLWDSTDSLIIVTGNSTLCKDGRVVMGRGAAKECKEKNPGIDYDFGGSISLFKDKYYGLVLSRARNLGLFQVKVKFSEPADLKLINYSACCLNHFCGKNPEKSISMNFPGIGYGELSRRNVLPLLKFLPDQVTIWEYEL